MNRVKLRFFAKKRVKHYFLFFEKISLSSYEISTKMLDNGTPNLSLKSGTKEKKSGPIAPKQAKFG